jgi:phosphoribosyl 1,2-cyclic phosphate phosphodiesterase
VCRSSDSRDARTRVSALLEKDDGTRILIDSPPELRLQLVREGVGSVDAVLYTHEHADHTHGIDDLRAISVRSGSLPVYGPPETLRRLAQRFDYIFDSSVLARRGTSKPQLVPKAIEAGEEVDVCGVSVLPVELDHGGSRVYGYRFGDLAYLTDVKEVPDTGKELLGGVKVLVVSALFERPLPMHFSIDDAILFARELEVERAYITHLAHQFTHAELSERLPQGIEPAFDGLKIAF